MKLILVVLSLFTVQAHANWYTLDSRSCSTGQALQVNAASDTTTIRYQVSEDLSRLTVEITVDGVTSTREYNLAMAGKNAYITSPVTGGDETDYFFVSTGDFPARVLISTADRTGEKCNGGLVLTSAVNQASTAASL